MTREGVREMVMILSTTSIEPLSRAIRTCQRLLGMHLQRFRTRGKYDGRVNRRRSVSEGSLARQRQTRSRLTMRSYSVPTGKHRNPVSRCRNRVGDDGKEFPSVYCDSIRYTSTKSYNNPSFTAKGHVMRRCLSIFFSIYADTHCRRLSAITSSVLQLLTALTCTSSLENS